VKNKNISGPEIARRRKLAKPPMTQLELSRAVQKLGVGLDRAAIAKIERGLRGVMDYELVAIAKALGVGVERMVSGKR
jgi:transcriptional regulator with XRE-family HTH domain